MQFDIGDHLISWRLGYTHHGIYIGDGEVIHYSGLANGLSAGPVEITTLEAFAAGRRIAVRRYTESEYNGEGAVRRARSRLGEDRYDLQANNCEHFCTWVRTGQHFSKQVRFVETAVGAFGAGIGEYRRQRFHKATAAEAALETGKTVARTFVRQGLRFSPMYKPLDRLLKK